MLRDDPEDFEIDDEMPQGRDLAALRAFGDQTLITTERGPVKARDLTAADRVRSKTGEYVGIDWIEKLTLGADFLAYHPALKPVLICTGDLGEAPRRNVVLSPEQMIWTDDARTGGVFRKAKDVTPYPDVYKKTDVTVTYVALLCTKPTVVEAEGLWISLTP